ncbi:unnamed protein product, partial [Choristocarpus tenellus]
LGIVDIDLVVVPWLPGAVGERTSSDRGEQKRDCAKFVKSWNAMQFLVEQGLIKMLGADHFLPWQISFAHSQAHGARLAVNVLPIR